MNRVLIVAPWLEGGGAQKALSGIVAQARDRGVNVTLVTLFDGCGNCDELVRSVDQYFAWSLSRNLVGTVRASRKLERRIRAGNYDKVYSLIRASSIVFALLPGLRQLGPRLGVSIHQLPWSDSKGGRGRLEEFLHRRSLGAAALVTSPSKEVIDYITSEYGIHERVAVVEPNILTLDTGGATRAIFTKSDPLRLVFCGRLTTQKGLDRLLDLLGRVERPIELVIVGDGDQSVDLKGRAENLSSTRHAVRFLGRQEDVKRYIDRAHLAILPSRVELEPVFVWESWSRGRAVLASDIEAFRTLSKIGPVVCFTSDENLVQLLSNISSDSDEVASAFECGIKVVNERQDEPSQIVSFFLR